MNEPTAYSTGPARELRIDDLVIDPVDGTLRRGEQRDALKFKSLQVLLHLLRRAPELVTREELLEEVWPDVVVTEAVLSTSIWELRSKLGDDPDRPRYIQTIRGQGYRYVGPTPESGADERPAAVTTPAPLVPSPARHEPRAGRGRLARDPAGERRS